MTQNNFPELILHVPYALLTKPKRQFTGYSDLLRSIKKMLALVSVCSSVSTLPHAIFTPLTNPIRPFGLLQLINF